MLANKASAFYPTEIGEVIKKYWDTLVRPNIKAPLFLGQVVAPELKKRKGCIVNMVDIHADRPFKNYTVYSIAKAGLVALTKSLARYLARRCESMQGRLALSSGPRSHTTQRNIRQLSITPHLNARAIPLILTVQFVF